MKNYRIKEHAGVFTVEIEIKMAKGFIDQTQISVFKQVNKNGREASERHNEPVFSTDSLEKARAQIKIWNIEPIYHQP